MGPGCANPHAIASLRPGRTALDLGSGGGFDCFLAARAVGVGIILLGQNAVRYLSGIRPRGGAVVLGILALSWGACGFYGVKLPFFAILFILIGAAIILFPGRGSWRCGGD